MIAALKGNTGKALRLFQQSLTVAAQQALDKGLEDPADAHMLAGMAYSEQRQFAKAIEKFRTVRSVGDEKQRKNATAWISFVQEKMAVQAAAN